MMVALELPHLPVARVLRLDGLLGVKALCGARMENGTLCTDERTRSELPCIRKRRECPLLDAKVLREGNNEDLLGRHF
jgi:hypothetical protein